MKKIENKINDLGELLFFLAYFIYLVTSILNASFYAQYISITLGKLIMIFIILIILVKEVFYTKSNNKEIVFLAMCIFLSLIIAIHTNGYTMFPLFALIYGSRRISFKKIAKFTVYVSTALLLFIVFSAKLGIIQNYVSTSNNRVREYLGFRYSLYPSMLWFNINALILYLIRKKGVYKYIILILISFIIFKCTNSRLSFYISLLLITLVFIFKNTKIDLSKMNVLLKLVSLSFVIFSFLSLVIIFTYNKDNKIMNYIDIKFEHRISLGKRSLNEYPINLFGYDVKYIGAGLNPDGTRGIGKYNYVDCLYLNILEKHGVIFFVFYLVLITYTMLRIKSEKEYILLIILFMYALHGVIDDLGMNLYYNTFLLTIGTYCKTLFMDNKMKKVI